MPSIVTANSLRGGEVVYLTANGRWVETIGEAAIASDKPALAELEGIAARDSDAQIVTAVYAMDVRIDGGRPVPISVREKIRAARGPTTDPPPPSWGRVGEGGTAERQPFGLPPPPAPPHKGEGRPRAAPEKG